MIIYVGVNVHCCKWGQLFYLPKKHRGKLHNKSGWNRGENSTLRDFSTASIAMSVGVARDQTIERTLFVVLFFKLWFFVLFGWLFCCQLQKLN